VSRLWQQQGKREEALDRLSEIYGWFTEGFATKGNCTGGGHEIVVAAG
jgi:hypothetical protein